MLSSRVSSGGGSGVEEVESPTCFVRTYTIVIIDDLIQAEGKEFESMQITISSFHTLLTSHTHIFLFILLKLLVQVKG